MLNYSSDSRIGFRVYNESNQTNPVMDFFLQLGLSSADCDELWRKRGLNATECKLAGFKTNDRSNREILVSLGSIYSPARLFEEGLWVRTPAGEYKPNSQFCGYGLVSRQGGPGDSEVWGWKDESKCNPIIIPYFDAGGRPFYIRPHKGGVAGKPPHLYVARSYGICDQPCETAVITEGEFKARALNAVLNHNSPQAFATASMPGISMAKHKGCLAELFAWLRIVKPSRVVVSYDSEEKGNPRLPSYKPNPRKRYDAQIWARYLANVLAREGYEALVGVIPKTWRDQTTGKADWDSRLANRIAELTK